MTKTEKEAKFEKQYSEWVQPLFRFVYAKCRDQALAEDIVQEAFVNYWDKMDAVKEGNERSYLYTAVRNILINKINRQKTIDLHRGTLTASSTASPHYDLEVSEFQKRLEHGIANLPEGQQEVFLLNRIEGLKYREIAALLSISQKAVEKRMSQALSALRKIYHKI